jgi:hypothetical protein
VSTQLLALDDEQHRHPWHSSNGSYDTAAGSTDDDGRYTTLFTGTYSSSCDADADGLLLDSLPLPPACLFKFTQGRGLELNQEQST